MSLEPKFEEMRTRLEGMNLLPPQSIDEFVLHPIWGCKKVSEFNRAHIDYFSARSNAMVVSYEELRTDTRAKLSDVLDFLKVKNYDIERIVSESSFENMRRIELNADPETKKKTALYGMRGNDENSMKVRRGKVNGYLDELKPHTVDSAKLLCLYHRISA